MDILQDIIQRCHQRHADEKKLRQRKTVVMPALYRSVPYYFKVHCARRTPTILDALEQADISFMPIGHAPENDRGPRDLGGRRFLRRQGITHWRYRQWFHSWGIQIYTGTPSEQAGAMWHDLVFTYQAICDAPETVLTCIESLLKIAPNPLLVLTKSGDLRFSCRVKDYLHPNTDAEKFYVYKHTPTAENPNHRDVYLEIRGDKGYSRWDMRYEILIGDLLDPPVVAKEVLFVPIEDLRAALHVPQPHREKLPEPTPETANPVPASLGSENLDLAKAALLQRGFSYDREDSGFHHWIHHGSEGDTVYVSIWEARAVVWIRTDTPNTELPIRGTPITEIWDDTGITPPKKPLALIVRDKTLAIREGKLSPLAIKRLPPKLQKLESTPKAYATLEENAAQIQQLLESDARILGITTSEAGLLTACQEHGYLSQLPAFKDPKAQGHPAPELLLNPQYADLLEDEIEQACITHGEALIGKLFRRCVISKKVVEAWIADSEKSVLGNFAAALMNVLETQGESYSNPIGQIRAAVTAFEQHAAEIIQQMCHINVEGKGVAREAVAPSNPNWTFWHQLQQFFAHYTRDADAPMRWGGEELRFWVPPILHPKVKRLLVVSTFLPDQYLRTVFPGEKMETVRIKPTAWVPGNQVFQLRTISKLPEPILNYDSNWGMMGLSKLGERYFWGIRTEIDKDPNVKHAIITNDAIKDRLADLAAKENVCFVANLKELDRINADFEAVQVVWIVGTPHWEQQIIWWRAQMLFGNEATPLNYEGEINTGHYKDERIQGFYNQSVVGLLTRIISRVGLDRQRGKKVVLLMNFELPDITDRPETLLFDWEDFEVAGGLDKLPETIATREQFEAENAELTAESSREEVERVLGCSSRQANRVLVKLRGGNIPRVTFREQILAALANGEKRTGELVGTISGHPNSILKELKRLADLGEIVKVRRGMYKLP